MLAVNTVSKNADSQLVALTDAAITRAILKTDLTHHDGIYAVDGMSSMKYRYFINTLVGSVPNARYLEIGSWAGSTLCAAIHGNQVTAVAVDDWSQFGGPKDHFISNVMRFRTPGAEVTFIEADFRKVDYTLMNAYNVYLFDGPHKEQDQYDGLAMVLPCLDPEFVFIVDDWNWSPVRKGTLQAIERCGLEIRYAAEIRSSLDETHPVIVGKYSDWHNGYFISVLAKPA
jgi:hypothetical protein